MQELLDDQLGQQHEAGEEAAAASVAAVAAGAGVAELGKRRVVEAYLK
jgi:hypothetical protein